MIERFGAVLRRWVDLTILAVVAVAVIRVVALTPGCDNVVAYVRRDPLSVALLVGALSIGILRRRALGFLGFRHLGTFPPLWIAAIGGVALLHWFAPEATSCAAAEFAVLRQLNVGLQAWLLLAFVAVGVSVAMSALGNLMDRRRYRCRDAGSFGSLATATNSALEWDPLRRWVLHDIPVGTRNNDLFGRAPIADRITQRIQANVPIALGLVGEMGSGKSTVLALCLESLGRELGSRIIIARCSLWPYHDTEAAVRGILNTVTAELRRHVDTTRVEGVPKNYAAAVESGVGMLGHLIGVTDEPTDSLGALNTIATAADLVVVLWIEDIERFFVASEAGENVSLQPIYSLIHTLSGLSRFRIVVSLSESAHRFDFEKMVRYVEYLPPLAAHVVRQVVANCYVGLYASEGREPTLAEAALGDIQDGLESMSTLARTPRRLKYALRAFVDTVGRIGAEINRADLLKIAILRSCEPAIFAMIESSIDELREGVEVEEGRVTPFAERVDSFFATEDSQRRRAVEALLTDLFPGWQSGEPAGVPVQRLAYRAAGLDYWNRYVTLALDQRIPSDATIQRAIEDFKQAKPKPLIELLTNPETIDPARAFVKINMGPGDAPQLLRELVQAELPRSNNHWRNYEPLSIRGLPDAIQAVHADRRMLSDALMDASALAIKSNFAVAHSLMYWFASRDAENSRYCFGLEGVAELETRFAALLSEHLRTGSLEEIAHSFENGAAADLSYYVFGLIHIRAGDYSRALVPRWGDISPRLLDVAERFPNVLLPKLLFLVTLREHRIGLAAGESLLIQEYSVNQQGLASTFSNHQSRLGELFRKHSPADTASSEIKERWKAAEIIGREPP